MKDKKNQQGSIVIYATFLMIILCAIVTLLAFIILVSIRSTSNSKQSIVAFYAAESGLEKSLYTIKTNRDSQSLTLASTITSLNGLTVMAYSSSTDVILADNSSTTVLDFNLLKGQSKQIDIFNPDSGLSILTAGANANLSWTKSGCTGTGNPIEYGKKEFSGLGGSYWGNIFDNDYLVSLPSSSPYVDPLLSSYNYQFKIKALECDLSDIQFTITSGSTAVALPNYITIRSTGTNGKASIKLQADTIWKPPLSGLGEYVLFSEDTITK